MNRLLDSLRAGRYGVLPPIGSTDMHRVDAKVTGGLAFFCSGIMLLCAPFVRLSLLMAAASVLAVIIGLITWTTPVSAAMWRRHAQTAASMPVSVMSVAAGEIGSDLRVGAGLLVWNILTVACLRSTRSVMAHAVWAIIVYSVYLFLTLPLTDAILGTVAASAPIIMVGLLVSVLRTSLDRVVAELRQQAERDPLTGLQNRHGLRHSMTDCPLDVGSVVLLDLDHFKSINDVHGHQAGDETLMRFADLLRSCVRAEGELAVRMGGEEFLLLLPDVSLEDATARADDLRQLVAAQPRVGAAPVTMSAGVAFGRLIDFSDLVRRADQALYRAKSGGRNRVECAERPSVTLAGASPRPYDGHPAGAGGRTTATPRAGLGG